MAEALEHERPLPEPILGILGGMGPAASAHFYSALVRHWSERYGATRNDQFPNVLLSSLPVRDLVRGVEPEESERCGPWRPRPSA